MEYKLLVSDLDGTLLDGNSQVTDSVREAVREAEAHGLKVALGSGRSYVAMELFERDLGTDAPGHYGIAFNGGAIYEVMPRRILKEYRLERELGLKIVTKLKEMGAEPLVYVGPDLIAERETENVAAYHDASRLPLKLVKDFSLIQEDFSKVIIRSDNTFLSRLYDELDPLVEGQCNCFFSAKHLLEFCPTQATKGNGLSYLCEYLGIDVSEAIAAGDQENDISMLKRAGLGVAVQNAVSDVKNAADVVTDATNVEGAIQEIIYKYVL